MDKSEKLKDVFDFKGDDLSDDLSQLARAYSEVGRSLDSLPYTEEFEALCKKLPKEYQDKREILMSLFRLRKAGRLPRLGRTFDAAPSMSRQEEEYLASLVVEAIGSLGARDRLPYSPDFDSIYKKFTTTTERSLSPHELWRLIARLAK